MNRRQKLPPYQRKKPTKTVNYFTMSINATMLDLPNGMEPLEHQVAGMPFVNNRACLHKVILSHSRKGHTFQVGNGTIGEFLLIFFFLCNFVSF